MNKTRTQFDSGHASDACPETFYSTTGHPCSKAVRRFAKDQPLHDECGVFGYYAPEGSVTDAARQTYLGLFALQHRGQDSAGIAVNNQGTIFCHRNQGLVVEVFNNVTLNMMQGHAAIGHVRYPSQTDSGVENAQPMLIKYKSGQMALAINGCILNSHETREQLQENGAIFQTNSDAEVVLSMLARNRIMTDSVEEAIQMMMPDIKGAYGMVLMTPGKIIGLRDPLGIRPLCVGKLGNAYILASESCAIDSAGGTFLRDVKPGEMIVLSDDGMHSYSMQKDKPVKPDAATHDGLLCLFEFVYFARPDSTLDGSNVHEARFNAGQQLALEHPCQADLVIGAPDSGMTASMGYARASGIAYGQGLLKNRYVGRTFIQPDQMQRELSVTMKFSALRHAIAGKRVLMVDDSIVRGTTTSHIVNLLRRAGATEVHMRIASPPVVYPCFYGVDTPSQDELSASKMSIEAIRDMIGADSLGYLSLDGLKRSTHGLICRHCASCFDGVYPAGVPADRKKEITCIDRTAFDQLYERGEKDV